MNKALRILGIVAFIIAIPVLSAAAGRDCINWARIMSIRPPSEGKIVAVEPFTDYTKQAGDEWLSAGLRDLTASMLSTSSSLRVYSGLTAKYNTEAMSPAFTVSGMYQHVEGGLRVFVKVMQAGNLVSQYEILSPYPESGDIFMRFADVTKQIWKTMQTGGDESALAAVRDATPSTRTFESYIKGRQAFETYKQDEMEVAKTWFEQAKKSDYRSPLGYQGLIDLLTFLGFYHKQRQEPFGPYFQQAERELSDMNRIAKRPPPVVLMQKKPTKKSDGSLKFENPFLLNQASFNEGLIAAGQEKWVEAAAALKKAVEHLPEDAIAWYHLARIYERLGNSAEASKALQKAYEINPCMEK